MLTATRNALLFVYQVAALVFLTKSFAFATNFIPSESMVPTLEVGDRIVVTRWPYGYSRHSLLVDPGFAFPGPDGRVAGRLPERGDIVVFTRPRDGETLVKRVIGLPGDRIQVRDSVLYINDKPVPRVAEGTFSSDTSDTAGVGVQHSMESYRDVPIYRETLDSGASYQTLDLGLSEGDNTPVFNVPEKHYFMMGDNRDNSSDSRFSVKYVPEENLVGRASFIIFSLGNDTPFFQVWKWPTNLRYDRFFKGIR